MPLKSLFKTETLASFASRGYPWLWLSISTNGYANVVSQIAIGWLALELTGSPLGVGIAVASRALPRIVFGVPFGALSDLYDRKTILQLTNFFGVFIGLGAIAIAGAGGLNFAVIVGIAVGAFAGMGVAYLLSGISLWGVAARRKRETWESSQEETPASPFKNIFQGITQIGYNRPLSLLAGLAVTMEVLAFSSDVLLPSFARDILKVGETGLGTLTAIRSVGGVIGVLIIASLPQKIRKGQLLLYASMAFGLGLVAFAHAPVFLAAIAVMLFIGGMWASVDSLLPTLVQFCVGDEKRGAAVGVWNLSRGLGPLGHLEVGALADVLGASMALTINGAFVFLIVFLIARYSRRNSISFNVGI